MLETWRAFLVEGGHVHSAGPYGGCVVEALGSLREKMPELKLPGLAKVIARAEAGGTR